MDLFVALRVAVAAQEAPGLAEGGAGRATHRMGAAFPGTAEEGGMAMMAQRTVVTRKEPE